MLQSRSLLLLAAAGVLTAAATGIPAAGQTGSVTPLVAPGSAHPPDKVVARPSGPFAAKGPAAGLAPQDGDKSYSISLLTVFPRTFRGIDGAGNNGLHPEWGVTNTPFLRLCRHGYDDGSQSPAALGLPNPREVSNAVVAQDAPVFNTAGASDFLWQWGQFIDHDLDLAPEADPSELDNIAVPPGDAVFDPFHTGVMEMSVHRSAYTEIDGVREQMNLLTAYIDGSMVYGSDAERAEALRADDGSGRLATSEGGLLPFNTAGLPNGGGTDPSLFLAGDQRVNEQIGLIAMHTLFVREHNYWADHFAETLPFLDGDTIYELARGIVVAEIQAITVREFLPVLLGPQPMPAYEFPKLWVDASVSNEFATAAYRVGHTMLNEQLQLRDAAGNSTAGGPLALVDAFFRPDRFVSAGMDNILRGLASQRAQQVDTQVVDAVRNFLFAGPGSPGFDLASLNIQRGREHGLPRYNQARIDLGLAPRASFADVTPDAAVQAKLASVYASVEDVDLWVGGLAEPHVGGGVLGETFHAIIHDQFLRIRDGDRFWYESYLPGPLVELVHEQTLATIIRRNSGIGDELQGDVFHIP